MLINYILLFILGHVLGDFYLQSQRMAELKDKKYRGVLLHSLEYFIVVIVVMLPVISLDMIFAASCLGIMHFIIDSLKYVLLKTKKIGKNEKTFIVDQLIHILSILVLAYIMYYYNFKFSQFCFVNEIFASFKIEKITFLRWILVVLILHIPTNILIQGLLMSYKPRESTSDIIVIDNKAGRRIGTMERIIMLMFIAMDQYAAMGLVLTAKSIARYDKITKDEKFAEYYLLGTLLSTASVVACKLIFL